MTTKLYNKYFINRYTGEYYWIKNNKDYDELACEQINNNLQPLKNILANEELFYNLAATDDYRKFF